MKRLILAATLHIALGAHLAIATPTETQAAAWLDKAETIKTVYSENITPDSVLTLLLIRTPSTLPRSSAHCGAGLEDHAVLMLNKNGKQNYRRRLRLMRHRAAYWETASSIADQWSVQDLPPAVRLPSAAIDRMCAFS